uniref:RE1-silencing transcription factor A n=1 Tax=Cacopsylla melanoneura TaxID=428564 RepID=A0A8D9A7X3_9HEMI
MIVFPVHAPGVFKCIHCEALLPMINKSLMAHSKHCDAMDRHNNDRNYTFVCFACTYHAARSDYMTSHIRRHTGEKPYKCSYCSYESSYPSDLKRHVRIRHNP